MPITSSCRSFPLLRMTKVIVSPSRTAIDAGVKRIVSSIATFTLRVAALGSPSTPKA